MDPLDAAAEPLWASYRDDATKAATSWALVAHYSTLAEAAARRRGHASGLLQRVKDEQDLGQELLFVLGELVEAFNPAKGVPFSKYARHRLALRAISVVRTWDPATTRSRRANGTAVKLVSTDDVILEDVKAGDVERARDERDFRRHLLSLFPSRRDRLFILLRWYRGHSLGRIADRLGIHQTTLGHIQRRVLLTIVRSLGREDLAGEPVRYAPHAGWKWPAKEAA